MKDIKLINNFISKEDSLFLIDWIDRNSHDDLKFKSRVGIASNKGWASRAIFPDQKPPSLFKDLEPIVNKYSQKFIDTVKSEYGIDKDLYFYGVSITKLSKDIQLRIHQDVHNDFSSLVWSCVVYLNDNYSDGEVVFLDSFDKADFEESPHAARYGNTFYLYKDGSGGLVYKPEAFDAFIFPSDQWHGGRMISDGTKYAVILWLVKEKEYEFKGFDSEEVLNNMYGH